MEGKEGMDKQPHPYPHPINLSSGDQSRRNALSVRAEVSCAAPVLFSTFLGGEHMAPSSDMLACLLFYLLRLGLREVSMA